MRSNGAKRPRLRGTAAPVARLVPIEGPKRGAQDAVDALLAFRESPSLEGLALRDLIEEGRRH